MNRNENQYYRYEPSNKFKVIGTNNNILGTSQQRYSTAVDRKTDVSKEKQNDRVINLDKRVKRQPIEEEPKRVSNNFLTFKTMMGMPAQIQMHNNIQNTQPT